MIINDVDNDMMTQRQIKASSTCLPESSFLLISILEETKQPLFLPNTLFSSTQLHYFTKHLGLF